MSGAPIPAELAEFAAQRLDGDIADEAWRALEQQHGDALAQALAREAATREALRALPREPAPRAVIDAILAHAAKAPAPAARAASPSGGGSLRWWAGAAILAAACLVTGIMLRIDHPPGAPTGSAASSDQRVARVEPQQAQGGNLALSATVPPAEEAAKEKAGNARELDGAVAATAAPYQAAKPGADAFGKDDAKRAESAPDADAARLKDQVEPLAKLEQEAKPSEDLDRLRDEAAAWRLAHPAQPTAAAPPKTVLEQADQVGGAGSGLAANQSGKQEQKKLDEELAEAGAPAGEAQPAADAPAAEAGAVVAKADRKDFKAAAAPPPGRAGGRSPDALKAGAPPPAPAAAPNGPVAVNELRQQEAQHAADADKALPNARRASASTVLALLGYDDARTAVMTLENRDATPLLVRRASLTLEGIGSDGRAAWTFTTGQPGSDTTLQPSARASWRVPLTGAFALQGAATLRLRFLDAVSPDLPWPPPAATGVPAAAPAAEPAKP